MTDAPETIPAQKRRWPRILLLCVALLVGTGIAALLWLDSSMGQRWLINKLASAHGKSGFQIVIGDFQGSLYSKAEVKNVELRDPHGTFLTIHDATINWSPAKIWSKTVDIRSADIRTATWHCMPAFNPGDPDAPILPDWNIRIDHLRIGRLTLDPRLAKKQYALKADGHADIRAGRVQATLDVAAHDAPDTARIFLDAVPDANRFDADIRLVAPRNGLIATVTGWQAGGLFTLTGKGDYQHWRGNVRATSEGIDALSAQLVLDKGSLSLTGKIRPPQNINPRLAAAMTALPDLAATVAHQRGITTTSGTLTGGQATVGWDVSANLATNAIFSALAKLQDNDGHLIALLDPDLKSSNASVTVQARGNVRAPAIDARISADHLAWFRYSLDHVSGTATTQKLEPAARWQVAVKSEKGRTGVAWLDPKLTPLTATGQMIIQRGVLTVDQLRLAGTDLMATGQVITTFATGAWRAVISALDTRLALGENGLLPVQLRGQASAASSDTPVLITTAGTVSLAAWRGPAEVVRLFGRTPAIHATLTVQQDGTTRASALGIDGNGSRFAGTLALLKGDIDATLSGRIKSLSSLAPGLPFRIPDNVPVSLVITGPMDHPRVAGQAQVATLQLGGTQLRNVILQLQPAGSNSWDTSLNADGAFGKLDSKALVQTGTGGVTLRQLSGTAGPARLAGDISIDRAGLATGTATLSLSQAAQTLNIDAVLGTENKQQKISARIDGANIRQLWEEQPVTVDRITGSVQSVLGRTPTLQAQIDLKGGAYRDWRISDLKISGTGPATDFAATYAVSGFRGTSFALSGALTARGQKNLPDMIDITSSGTIAGRNVKLTAPARMQRTSTGWQLANTELAYAGGTARLSGTQAGPVMDGTVELTNTTLELLDLIAPNLGLTGKANGTATVQMRNGKLAALAGTMALKRVRRAGLFQSSLPLDLTGTAKLDGSDLQSQIQLRVNGADAGNAMIRLQRSGDGGFARGAVAGNFNYAGPAEALWGLIGTDANDVRGKLSIQSTIAGTLDTPRIRGSAAIREGRYENVALGFVVQSIVADGAFEGAQLTFDKAQGIFPAGGIVTGKGKVDVSVERGFPAEINLNLVNAAVIKQEDLQVVATGPLFVTYGLGGGRISGPLTISEARIRAGGRVSETVTDIDVREINKPLVAATVKNAAALRSVKPWALDLDVSARQRLFVSGLGLISEWGGKVAVTGTSTAPRLNGQMSLVRGTYDFAGRRFVVDDGVISFQGTTPVNPVLNIKASTRAGDRDIIIRVTGASDRPNIQFAASPSLPQDEVLSRLLFGTSIQDLSPLEAVQLASALNQLSNSRSALNVFGQVRRVTGIDRLRVLAADPSKGKGTALSGGKYLTDRVYVEVSTDGRGYTATVIEVDITRTLSVLSEIATLGGTNVGIKYSKEY